MCRVSEKIYNEGKLEGKKNTTLASVHALMETVGWTARQALEKLKVPEAEWSYHLGVL